MGGKRARHDSDWREGLVGVERKRANKKATKGSRRMGKRCRRSVEEWQKSSSVAVYNTFKQTATFNLFTSSALKLLMFRNTIRDAIFRKFVCQMKLRLHTRIKVNYRSVP